MLTVKQYKLLMFINKVTKETGCCPSFDEMKDAIGLKSKSGIHALISALEEREFIKKLPHKARALEVLRLPKFKPSAILEEEKKREIALQNSAAQIPLYGKIAAGTPIDAIANETEVISVPFEMVAKGRYYALNIEGDSMVEAGILNGDTAIIKKADTADNGAIVVALVDNEQATLKVLQKKENEVWLLPCNKNYQTQKFDASRVKIQGVLSSIIRNYH
ncbi:MAG: transcriptional repressor LexA [Alphaproteobacteria bacterium]|nr:transcriptional repressor LexA [Alphaproteobacteria bacterium]MBO7097209.1 transcriptional repressor LexA [Alphaproteobacteria bacterium]